MVAIDVEADEKVHSNAFELSVLRLRTSRRRMLFSSLLLGALVFLMLVPDFALTSPTTTIPRKDLQKDATLPQSQPDQPEKNAELQSGAAAVVAAKEEFEKLQDDEVVVGKYFNQLHNLGRQLDQRVAKLAESLEKVKKLEEEQVAQREDHKHNLVAAQKSHDAALDELKAEMELKLTEFKEDQEERRKQFEEDPEVKEALLHPHPLAAPPPQFPPQFDIHPEPMPELIKDVPLDDPVAENERRQERVLAMFKHAWQGYKKYAWGHDELGPLTKRGLDWSKLKREGFGFTILDGMSTMWLMDLKAEFEESVEWVDKHLSFAKDADMSQFEATIRMLGGLLSAYELSGEQHHVLVTKARDLGNRLLHAYNTTLGVPHAQVNFVRHTHSSPRWSGGSAVLAEFGSVQLEMRTLTYHTGDPQYNRRAQHVMNVVRRHLPPDGLVPTYLDPETGAWNSDHITLGALGDSYYEYLLKQWLLSGKTDTRYKEMFEQAADSIINKLVKPTGSGGAGMYLAEMKRGAPLSKMDHLACFAGGMFALASHHIPDKREQYLKVAAGITHTCHDMYQSSKTKLSPESVMFNSPMGSMAPSANYYILRPETVESYFYMWRMTKEQKYRDWGWEFVLAAEQWCKVPSGGYSGLKNVNRMPPEKDDLMQSFWLAETLKYLFLLFSDDDKLDLDKWVINTEAHPMKVREAKFSLDKEDPPKPSEVTGYQQANRRMGGGAIPAASTQVTIPGYTYHRNLDAPGADAKQPGKYRCGCGVLISNVGKAEREHCKSDRHQKWLKSQQITKTLSAFFVKEQNPVGSSSSSSSSSSITNTSNNCNTNSSSSSNANSSSCSRGSITSGFNTNGYLKDDVSHLVPERAANMYIKDAAL